jgi:steroid delta-isomerase-like uncharacterized protein
LHAAYNRHDAAGAARLYAPRGTHEDVPQARVAEAPEAVLEGLERFFAAFPDAHWATEGVTGTGDEAAAAYRLTGTLTGSLGPFVPTGQRLDLRGVHVVQTDERGRIRRSTDYWDAATFARQMRAAADDAGEARADGPAPGAGGVNPEGFRRTMRLLAGGVVVVTTVVDGRPWGLTISACCSLTADPPRILVSLDSRTASSRAIVGCGRFGVDLLGCDQVEIARTCSATGHAKFIDEAVDTTFPQAGSPVVAGALAHLDCRLTDAHGVGDHLLLIGLVERIFGPRTRRAPTPLVYYERAFRTVSATIG